MRLKVGDVREFAPLANLFDQLDPVAGRAETCIMQEIVSGKNAARREHSHALERFRGGRLWNAIEDFKA